MQAIDVTKSTERVAEFVRRLGRKKKPVDILFEGKLIGRLLPAPSRKQQADFVSPAERQAAWKRIQKLQRRVGKSLREQGITEADVERAVLEDD